MAETRWKDLGPVTEERFRQAFTESVLIHGNAAAALLRLDDKCFREMVAAGLIGSVAVGVGTRTRRFTEAALREFLAMDRPVERPEARPRAPTVNVSSRVSFSQGRAVPDISELRASRKKPKA